MKFLVKVQQVRSYLIFCYLKSYASQSKWLISTNTPMIQHFPRKHLFFLKPLENQPLKKNSWGKWWQRHTCLLRLNVQTIKADFLILHDYCPKNKTRMWAPSFSWELSLVAFKKLWIIIRLSGFNGCHFCFTAFLYKFHLKDSKLIDANIWEVIELCCYYIPSPIIWIFILYLQSRSEQNSTQCLLPV